MTYRELAQRILNMSEEQMDMDVTVIDVEADEVYPVGYLWFGLEVDLVDENQPVLDIRGEA